MKKTLLGICCCVLAVMASAQVTDWKSVTKYDKKSAKEKLTKRFTHYVTFDTQANPSAGKVPSTPGQLALAKELAKELKKYGAKNVQVDKHALVTADIPSTTNKPAPTVAFVAHLDTAPQLSGAHVKPQVHKDYQGGDIVINAEHHLVLNAQNAPQLAQATGHDMITASGGTLLGTDNKAGVAILMTLVQYLYDYPDLTHGPLKIVFTPDQEIGTGARLVDTQKLGADYAYTVDGGALGEITNDTFTGKAFTAHFTGEHAVDLGQAMNSPFADNILMAADFYTLLPRQARPDTTSGRRGYIYVDTFTTQGDTTTLTGILRAFTDAEMDQLTHQLNHAFRTVKAMHNKATATLEVTDQFTNLHDKIPADLLTLTRQALTQEDIKPVLHAARGTTDGAVLSANNLPTPGLFSGQFNAHSEREYADVDVMEASLRTLLRLTGLWGLQTKN